MDVEEDWATFTANITLLSGDYGFIYFSQERSSTRGFRISIDFPSQRLDLRINLEKGKFNIGRNSVHETRFATPEVLDDLLPKVVQMVVDVDPIWPEWLIEKFGEPASRTPPLLKGLSIPGRHRSFALAIMGAPYETAKKRAQQFVMIRAKKAQAIKESTKKPKDFPDGMILAKLNKGAPVAPSELRAKDISRVYYVKTTSAPDAARRRRELVSPCRQYANKPLTPKNLLKLDPLSSSDTLQRMTDYDLGGPMRDFVEAAFHVALSLPAEALNPLFSHEPAITELDFQQHNTKVRITRSKPNDGHAMLAFRLVNTPPFAPVQHARSGVLFLKTPQGEQAFALATTLDADAALVRQDREVIEAAISSTFASDPALAKVLIGRARWAFNGNSKTQS